MRKGQICFDAAILQVWAILAAQFTQSVGMYGLLNWLPTYLHEARHIPSDSEELAVLAATPYAVQVRSTRDCCMDEGVWGCNRQ